jgi:hypothetical protein
MRIAASASVVCLLFAAAANAQPAPPAVLPTIPPAVLPNSPPAEPACPTALDSIVSANPWAMNGPRAWVNAEYLLWWVTPMNTPDLIQAVPRDAALSAFANSTSLPPGAAARFFPDTRQLQFGAFSGVRGTAGVNFERFGLEGSAFYLPQVTKSSSLFTDGNPLSAAQSYIRAGTGQPISLLASLAGQSTGGVSSFVSSKLWGAEGNVRLPWYNFLTDSTDALVGVRYLNLEEKLGINFQSNLNSGTSVLIQDLVQTRNQFYGGQLGMNGKINGVERGIGFDTTGKIALGSVRQEATFVGSNTIIAPGAAPDTQPGGLFASGANQGTFSRDKVAMIADLNLNVTYNFNRWSQVYVGYSILWISSVIRPGEAIDPVINDSRLRYVANPPASNVNRPMQLWNANDFWAQGITFGLRLQY